MANFVGMDVTAVRHVAASIKGQADNVSAITSTLNGLVHQASSHWHGAHATAFVQSWSSHYRPQMDELCGWLTQMATSLDVNASQQEQASSGGGSGRAAGTTSGGGSFIDRVSGLGGSLIGLAGHLSQNKFSMGDYTDQWRRVLDWGDEHHVPDGLLEFKKSPVLHELNKMKGVLDVAGKVASGLGVLQNGYSAFADFSSGKAFTGLGDVLDTANDAMGLTNMKLTPVTYLVGANLRIWGDDCKEMQNIDWSYTGQTWDYITKNPDVVTEELGDASVEVFKKLPGYFNPF